MTTSFSCDPTTWPQRPIILITGGNGGVGYGIALRLLQQLSEPTVSDLILARGRSPHARPRPEPSTFTTPNGATVILACRNAVKAHRAAADLRRALGRGKSDRSWKSVRSQGVVRGQIGESATSSDGGTSSRMMSRAEYRRRWLDNLRVEFAPIDLASVDSTVNCASDIMRRHRYITHLVCNAGGGPFSGIDFIAATKGVLTNFIGAVTQPTFIIARIGDMTDDGLGWTWQTNVFGHWVLARALLPALAVAPHSSPRILWTGSIDGTPHCFDPTDPQAIKHANSYQSAKFECALAGYGLNTVIAREAEEQGDVALAKVRSFVVEPGVVASGMFRELLGWFLDLAMKLLFYVARFVGSPHHVLAAHSAALAFVYVCLAPLSQLAAHGRQTVAESSNADPDATSWPAETLPVRFSARCDRLGRPYVGADVFDPEEAASRSEKRTADERWWWDERLAADTVKRCESTREKLLRARGLQ